MAGHKWIGDSPVQLGRSLTVAVRIGCAESRAVIWWSRLVGVCSPTHLPMTREMVKIGRSRAITMLPTVAPMIRIMIGSIICVMRLMV